jgi:hypothetical protein
VLSHPLLVEAAETLFVPCGIRNNSDGDADAATLRRFAEKAWNNPVVRFVDAEGKDLTAPLRTDWTVAGLAEGMVQTLATQKRDVPPWLTLLADGERAAVRGLERVLFEQT